MKFPRTYASASAFRVALESRLKKIAQEEGVDLQRVRQQAAFDRLLCRLFAKPNAPWLLKGGYAMELRLKTARTTRDIDLALKRLPVPSADWEAIRNASWPNQRRRNLQPSHRVRLRVLAIHKRTRTRVGRAAKENGRSISPHCSRGLVATKFHGVSNTHRSRIRVT
jgi:hypothetical protein